MPSSGYVADTFVANEQPTTAKWNELWGNDASFNSGAGFNDAIIITRHFATSGLQLPDKMLNPYKFSVYRAAAQTGGASSTVVIQFDTKLYDTGSNVDIVTNKGRFTAPIAGFYRFTARTSATVSRIIISLSKNGVEVLRGGDIPSGTPSGAVVTGTIQLAANDYVEATCFTSSAVGLDVNANTTYFQGELVSAT